MHNSAIALLLSLVISLSLSAAETKEAKSLDEANKAKSESKSQNQIQSSNKSKIEFPVEKYKLKNGLTVLLYQDNSAPIVSFHKWFRVGSKHEKPGMTGIAHLFEHMMFKGTKNVSNKQFDYILQSNGITNNAFTTRDYTGYFEILPSDKLELVMQLESDRLQNLIINAENLKSETEVVKEERRYRVDNDVMGKLFENLFSTVYVNHPYSWPVIGYMKDLNSLTVEQCQDFYKTYYSPNNAVLVIGGDIQIPKVKRMIEKYYSSIPAQKIPEYKNIPDVALTEIRKSSSTSEIQAPVFALSFAAPGIGGEDNYALDLLSSVLSNGESSRLYSALVKKKQLVSSISVFNYTSQDNGQFVVLARLLPGKKIEEVISIIKEEVKNIQTNGISAEELQKVKNMTKKEYVESLLTINGKTKALATNEILTGDYRDLFKDLERYNLVDISAVQDVSKKYLSLDKYVHVEILPNKK